MQALYTPGRHAVKEALVKETLRASPEGLSKLMADHTQVPSKTEHVLHSPNRTSTPVAERSYFSDVHCMAVVGWLTAQCRMPF